MPRQHGKQLNFKTPEGQMLLTAGGVSLSPGLRQAAMAEVVPGPQI